MPTADLTTYYQPQGSTSDGNKFDNLLAGLQALLNGLDDANVAAAAGILLSKLGQSAATQGQVPVWGGSSWAPSGSKTLIASSTPNAATVTFAAIPQTYRHLQIEYLAGFNGTPDQLLYVRFNGDVGASYGYDVNDVNNGVAAILSNAAASALVCGFVGTTAGFIAGTVTVPGYRIGVNKRAHGTYAGSGAARHVGNGGGFWNNPAAVSQIDLSAATGTFLNGSRFDLYGIG